MLKTFKGGIHPPYNKELTMSKAVEKAALPKKVIIPMGMHIGAPCEPIVKVGDTVKKGQKNRRGKGLRLGSCTCQYFRKSNGCRT